MDVPHKGLDLWMVQLELEGITVTRPGRLGRLSGEEAESIAACCVGRHDEGFTVFVRNDITDALADALHALPAEDVFSAREQVVGTFGRFGLAVTAAVMELGVLDPSGASDGSPAMVRLRPEHLEVHVGGRAVCWAWSARSNAVAAELAVETDADFRRRGLARAAALAWAKEVQAAGKLPFYSYEAENIESAALAQSLGVCHFLTLVNYV